MTFVAAIAPVIVIIVLIFTTDKYSKEPKSALLKAYSLGILTVMPALFLERFLLTFLRSVFSTDSLWFAFVNSFVGAGIIEEGMKFFVIYIFLLKHRNFEDKLDGIVYCVLISLGFATIENIMYSLNWGMSVAMARAATTLPAHTVFGIIMGYYLGISEVFTGIMKRKYLILGLLFPVFLHGLYDFILVCRIKTMIFMFAPYLCFLVFFAYKKAKSVSKML